MHHTILIHYTQQKTRTKNPIVTGYSNHEMSSFCTVGNYCVIYIVNVVRVFRKKQTVLKSINVLKKMTTDYFYYVKCVLLSYEQYLFMAYANVVKSFELVRMMD